MKLSPLEVRRHEFAVRMRGFDREEVKLFLDQLSTDWETVLEEERRAKARIEELEAKLNHYEKVEEALQEALRTARENAVKTQEHAKAQAEILLDEARLKAKQIVQAAEEEKREIKEQGRKLVAEAQEEKAEIEREGKEKRQQAERERTGVVLEIARLTDRRNHIQARLRSFLIAEMEMLAKFEEADPVGYIKFLPTVAQGGAVPEDIGSPTSGVPLPESLESDSGEGEAAQAVDDTDREETEDDSQPQGSAENASQDADEASEASYTVEEVVKPRQEEKGDREGEPSAASEANEESTSEEHHATAGEGEMDKIRRMLKDLD